MASEHDILSRLPEAPAPAPDAREAAIANALERFEKKNLSRAQGNEHDLRLTQQTASSNSPSRRSSVMPRARQLIAASLVALMAGSATWFYVNETSVVSPPDHTRNGGAHNRQGRAGPASVSPPIVQDQLAQSHERQPTSPPPSLGLVLPSTSNDLRAPPPGNRPEADIGKLKSESRPAPTQAPARVDSPRGRMAEQAATAPMVRVAPMPEQPGTPAEPIGRDKFPSATENAFKIVREAPVSTFSIDVDTASYSFMRASLNRSVLPQPAAVRTEELINYFPYAYPAPASASEPFRTTVAVFPSPWSEGRKIVQIGIKGYAVQPTTRPRANLVFLIDTSGSMNAPNRLPLVKQSLEMLVGQLEAKDRVAIVTYAGRAGTALEPTAASEKAKILGVIERLDARRQHCRRRRHSAGL